MFKNKCLILIVTLSIIIGFVIAPNLWAQTWQAMPPYNLLWPLWSPTLSPPDPVTGTPTPILTELTSSTVFPVQPVMALCTTSFEWPMAITMPWLCQEDSGTWEPEAYLPIGPLKSNHETGSD